MSDYNTVDCIYYYIDRAPGIIRKLLANSKFVNAAITFMRVKHIFESFKKQYGLADRDWEELKSEISKMSRQRLFRVEIVPKTDVADALSAIAIIENLNSVIQTTLIQTLLLFMCLPSYTALLKYTLLGCGGIGIPIPDPEEEGKFQEFLRIRLKDCWVKIDRSFIAKSGSEWLYDKCNRRITSPVNGRYLVDVMDNGYQLVAAEDKIRATLQGKWLETVFGGLWKKTSPLFVKPFIDLWTDVLEYHFMERMELILESHFMKLTKSLALKDSICRIAEATTASSQGYPEQTDLAEIGRIIHLLDTCCETALEDFLSFLTSPNASLRLKKVGPVLQNLCYKVLLTIIEELETETDMLYDVMQYTELSIVSVHQSLFIGRLLLAIGKLSKQIPLILGSTMLWVSKGSSERETSPQTSVLCGGRDCSDTFLKNFKILTQDLSIKAHDIWISWISERLSAILFSNLVKDEAGLFKAWDGTVAAEEHSAVSQSEMKVLVPCMPSEYVIIFLRSACEEVSRVGEHLLDGIITQNLASKLSGKVIETYGRFFSTDGPMLSRDGVLQILLDLGFSADILSGGDSVGSQNVFGFVKVNTHYEWRQDKRHTQKAVVREGKDWLINCLVQRLDPMEWLMYEPYLVEIKRQSYLHHAVNLKVFVQLNPMYTEYLGFGVATPFLKSLMQVGSGCSRSTLKLGSMLTNGQVGRSSVILHSGASGILSSFTEGRFYV